MTISGDMKEGVPPSPAVDAIESNFSNVGLASAIPQSITITTPKSPSITFSGLMSR